MKFVRFTSPDGHTVEVNPGQVQEVRDVHAGEYAPTAKALLVLGGSVQAVRESRDEVRKKLEAAS